MASAAAPRGLVWAADDSALHRESVRRALSGLFDVETFNDGAPMLERLASAETLPDALVLDWHMPDVSGLALCEYVRGRFDATSLPILILTSTAGPEDLLEALAAGANDYVGKPFHVPELVARVKGLVLTKRLGDALREEAVFRERFMGILGHDLRQPLNTLVLGTQALLRSDLPTAQAQTARRVANAADRMTRMVTDLLDVTRTRLGGGLPITRRWMDLGETCGQVVADTRAANPQREVCLTVSGVTTGLWDSDRLTQVCTNLLGNALEHGLATSPISVTISGEPAEVRLCVQNAGEPIAESLRPSIFQAFRRGRATASDGLGLGLFIVDQIVRAHGGTTSVTSNGEATRFLVRLPRETRSEPLQPARASSSGG